ncbi:MAG: cell envelope integrity protein CreD, partial [Vibrio sp.]
MCIVIAAIVLGQIHSLIKNRISYQDVAQYKIAKSWSDKQQIAGPVLVIPYTFDPRLMQDENYVEEATESPRDQAYSGYYYLLAGELNLKAKLTTQQKSIGTFSFPVYTTEVEFTGHIDLDELKDSLAQLGDVQLQTPYFAVSVTDMRGLNNRPLLKLDGQAFQFEPGSELRFSRTHEKQGLHATLNNYLDDRMQNPSPINFSFSLSLRGMKSLDVTPLATEFNMTMDSNWPHPSFQGKFLPLEHEITKEGFKAKWQVSKFSANPAQSLETCSGTRCSNLLQNSFGVALNTPVDVYRQSIRSVKYGLMFAGMIFAGFFLFEVVKKWHIHPVQYLMLSMPMCVFFLILVAFSERIGFMWAYMGSSLACVILLGIYLSAILKSIKWGALFAGFIASLYALMYVILNSEDSALLLGSIFIFALMSLVLISTRHVNWQALTQKVNPSQDSTSNTHTNPNQNS